MDVLIAYTDHLQAGAPLPSLPIAGAILIALLGAAIIANPKLICAHKWVYHLLQASDGDPPVEGVPPVLHAGPEKGL